MSAVNSLLNVRGALSHTTHLNPIGSTYYRNRDGYTSRDVRDHPRVPNLTATNHAAQAVRVTLSPAAQALMKG
ncbi:hypothetical protein [Asticcacaulis machinosus]|uniref:Uncharacterized protein n=1 Tax=Asticcacaulis machinosus TaxID=2984211 RepID=A0ABT5HHY0_9CAUL|nr:hypothetical protein [Asticcacaulis machinosus]MDC7675856.1 hypothetical protein [Asticcacaulis machinosus]